MAVSWPGHVAAAYQEDRYVSALDILPTVARATGITLADPTLDGIDLAAPDPDRLLVWKWQKTWAVRKGDYKLTNTDENHWKSRPSRQYIAPIRDDMSLKLFNLATDPGERMDLSAAMPERVSALQNAYERWDAANAGKY